MYPPVSAPAPYLRMPRADSLTGLRWWAAFGVFAYHMAILAPLPIEPVLRYGYLGVTFFFVLSGFVLTWSWSPAIDARTFWWRRFARIYPASLVALAIAIPVFYASHPDPAQWWVKPFGPVLLLSIPLIQGWWSEASVLFSGNPAAWTLTCEAFFYAMHPLLQRGLLRLRVRGALVTAGCIVTAAVLYRAACIAAPTAWWAASMPLPIVRISEFALGMCCAWAIRNGWRPTLPPWVGYLLTAAFAGWLAWNGVSAPTAAGPRTWALGETNEVAMVVCAVLIVLVATRDLRGGRSLLRTRVLVVAGEWSYAFYLVHATVIYVLLARFGPQSAGWGALPWYVACFAGGILLAGLLHLLVEKPCEQAMRRWWDEMRSRSARHQESVTP